MTTHCEPLIKIKEEDASNLQPVAGKRKRDTKEEDGGNFRPIVGKGKFMYVDVSLVQPAPPVAEPSDNESVATDDTECYDTGEPGVDCDRSSEPAAGEGREGGRRQELTTDSDRQEIETPASDNGSTVVAHDFIVKVEPTWNSDSSNEPTVDSEMNMTAEQHTVNHMESELHAVNQSAVEEPVFSFEKSIRNNLTEPKTGLQLQGHKERKVCSVCNAGFNYISDLRRHMRIHTGERPFACNECDARFNRADHLKCHVLTHSDLKRDPKKFRCSQCGYVFTRKFDLKRHALRKHSVEDALPFICCECDERFVTASEMNKHKRIHTGQKPFVCDVCQASFRLSSHLKAHATKHTEEKPLDMTGSVS